MQITWDTHCSCTTVLDVEDPEKPETWTFQLMTSWPRTEGDEDPRTRSNASLLADVKAKTSRFADPIRSANQWIPDGTKVNMNRVTYWQPIPWDNCGGTVTLAGDAAHPMTFRKTQTFCTIRYSRPPFLLLLLISFNSNPSFSDASFLQSKGIM